MKQTEFNLQLRSVSNPRTGLLVPEKIKALSNPIKNALINQIVRKRHAIVREFINEDTDRSWLASMGYMYEAKNKAGFNLLCTCENLPKS